MKRMLLYLVLSLFSFCLFCSLNPSVSGGSGTDIPDALILGIIIDDNNNTAANTQVTLIPADYNPVTDDPIPDSLIDTTDSFGRYQFVFSDTRLYNLEAIHLETGKQALVKGLAIDDPNPYGSMCDTIYIKQAGRLQKSGAIKAYVPDTVDTAGTYLFLKGTTINYPLSQAQPDNDGNLQLTLALIPEATFPTIYFSRQDNTIPPIALTDTFTVNAGGVVGIDASIFWAHYTTDNSSLPVNEIRDLHIDTDGSIWFATYGGGIANLSGTKWTIYNNGNRTLPNDNVLRIVKQNDGSLWFATLGGIAIYHEGGQWTSYTMGNSGIPSNLISDIAEDNKGNKWIGTYDVGLVKFDGTSWSKDPRIDTLLPSNLITSVLVDNPDTVWCTSIRKVCKHASKFYHTFTVDASILLSGDLYCMNIDLLGNKWFGRQGGVSRLNQKNTLKPWTHFGITNSTIFKDSVLTIERDNEGIMWFGTTSGLTKYDSMQWYDYTGDRYNLLMNKGIQCVGFDSNGETWIGTSQHGVIIFGPNIK